MKQRQTVYVVVKFCYGECEGVDSVWASFEAAKKRASQCWVQPGDDAEVREFEVQR